MLSSHSRRWAIHRKWRWSRCSDFTHWVVLDRNMIFFGRPIMTLGKNGISAENICQNAEYQLFWLIVYQPIGKTGNSANNIGRHQISVEHLTLRQHWTEFAAQSMDTRTEADTFHEGTVQHTFTICRPRAKLYSTQRMSKWVQISPISDFHKTKFPHSHVQ